MISQVLDKIDDFTFLQTEMRKQRMQVYDLLEFIRSDYGHFVTRPNSIKRILQRIKKNKGEIKQWKITILKVA